MKSKLKCGALTKMQEWHKQHFSGTDEAEVEEDLEEVPDISYATRRARTLST